VSYGIRGLYRKKIERGRYELIEELGEGGMGVVWRVLDPRTCGEVAIKIMKDISEYLRPHFQLEELNVSLRLVAKLPVKK
jgi:serine/threonine protein kinase